MDIRELGDRMEKHHEQTQEKLDKVVEDVTEIKLNVVKIESTMVTKDNCNGKRIQVFREFRTADNELKSQIRKVGTIKLILQAPLTVIGGLIGGFIAWWTVGKIK